MASFYAAFFAFSGIQMPYLPAWLATKGLDDREIGIVLAAPMAIRIVALPLAARLIDRRFDHKTALMAMAAAGAAGYAAIGVASGFVTILFVYATISVVQSAVLPVGDSYSLRGLSARGLAYGRVRLWGSVAFILANIGGGIFLATFGAGALNIVLAVTMAATAVAAWALPGAAEGAAISTKRRGGLWRSRLFVAVIAGASLVQASHAVMYGFATLQWSAAGLDGAAIGLLWAIGVIAEILLFAASGRLIARFGAIAMIMAGALGAVLRWTAMALDPPAALLPVLQSLHALSFGATHVGAMQVLSGLADRGGNATAQGDFSAVQGAIFAAAMGLSGVLVERFGDRAYWAMALVAVAGLLVTAAGRRWRAEANAP